MHHSYDRVWIVIFLITILSAIGCNHSPYELAPVYGKVSVNGRPLARAKVMFAPLEVGDNVNPGKPAFGMLQSDGSFELTTYKTDDGAILGEHWVTIINLAGGATKGATNASSGSFSRLTLPDRVKVQADAPNEFEIKITNEVVKQYGVQLSD